MFQLLKRGFADRWHQLTISRQLLIFVNSVLAILIVVVLANDYRTRMVRHVEEKRIALNEEAKTIYESLLIVESNGERVIQHLVDNICARMNTDDSPGHHIALEWRGQEYQAQSHGHASTEMMMAMKTAGQNANPSKRDHIVVGVFGRPNGMVYVSENRGAIVAEIRQSLLMQMFVVLLLGATAAFVVNVVLRQLIAKPIRGFVQALQSVASGNLSVIASKRSCKELSYLADQINEMTHALHHAAEDRRIHMEKARQIQRHLLPSQNGIQGISVAELFEPAEEVGGDYYDVIRLADQRYLLCLADVSGHGVPAALAATVIKTLVLEAIEVTESPAKILGRINRRYTEIIMPGHFATMVVVVIDNENMSLTCGNAGHEHPFIHMPGKPVERFSASDLVLGVDENTVYHEETMRFESGTKIVLVSDGITEMFDPAENQFGTQRVSQVIQESNGATVQELVGNFTKALSEFRGSRAPFDDTTLLAAQVG